MPPHTHTEIDLYYQAKSHKSAIPVCTFCCIDMLDPISNEFLKGYESNINKYLITDIWIYSYDWCSVRISHKSESFNTLSKNETDSNICSRVRPACSSLSRTLEQLFFLHPSLTSLLLQCNAVTKYCTSLASYFTLIDFISWEKSHQPWSYLSQIQKTFKRLNS